MTITQTAYILALGLLVTACGTGSESSLDDSPETTVSLPASTEPEKQGFHWPPSTQNTEPDQYGYLVDSAVSGLRYISGNHFGLTGADGKFGYMSGEPIQFYIGNNLIAQMDTPTELITPYDFSPGSTHKVISTLMLLQSLDNDGNPENGIQITQALHTMAESVAIKPPPVVRWPPDFLDNDTIVELTGATKAGSRNAVSAYEAYSHFAGTILDQMDIITREIKSVAAQSTCTTAYQCRYTILEAVNFPSHCYGSGLPVLHSNNNFDQLKFDTLAQKRQYLVDALKSIRSVIIDDDRGTSFCMGMDTPEAVICDATKHCAVE